MDFVCVANDCARHGGGLAKHVQRVGGAVIRDESREWLRLHGRVPVGDCAVTAAGNLPCAHVVHAVGPIYCGGTNDEAQLLHKTIVSVLAACARLGCSSVALPAVSAGAFG